MRKLPSCSPVCRHHLGGRNLSRETWEWEGTVNARPGRARLTSAMSVGDRVGEGGRIVPHITNIISHPPRLQGPRHEFRAGLWGTIRSRGCELQTREGATPPRVRWRCGRNKLERADVCAGVERKSLAISSNGIVLWCRRRIGRVPITDAGRKGAAVVVTVVSQVSNIEGRLRVWSYCISGFQTKVPRTSEFVRPASHGWNQADGFPRILHYPPSGSRACDSGIIKMTRRAVSAVTKGPTAHPSKSWSGSILQDAVSSVQCIALVQYSQPR